MGPKPLTTEQFIKKAKQVINLLAEENDSRRYS